VITPRNFSWALGLAALVCQPVWAQAPAKSTAAATTSPVNTESTVGHHMPATTADVAQMREQLTGMDRSMRDAIATVRPSWWERLVPALIGLLGVLVGGVLSTLQQQRQIALNIELQKLQLKEGERIGHAKAGFESLSKVVDYQSRQINEFYYPLRLMLRRSSGVRRQLCDQLSTKAPKRFVFNNEADGRTHLFVVEADGKKKRFRLIEHMNELATSHAEFLPLVKEIVNIGSEMSALIHNKGGMTIAGSESLTVLLGIYLAHFSILRDVANKAEKSPAVLATLKYNVAYPVELDAVLDVDIALLTAEIEKWKTLSQAMWQPAPPPSAGFSRVSCQ
jgi:hypothetical protein